MNKMSSTNRRQRLNEIAKKDWDLIVIGGGATGAGILLDAVSRGLQCLLLEKKDYAWGTSSRSTKLIHGGLRYLKQFEVALVREVGLERAIVHNNARHIVVPEPMLLPIVTGGSLGKFTSSIGLWVYDWLADVNNREKRIMLSKEEILEIEPMLRKDILEGGGLYYEYRTDDARLTIELIKKAVELGATALNYSEVTNFIYTETKISGVIFNDVLTGKNIAVNANFIVNSTGPWVDKIRSIDEGEVQGKHLQLTKGVHIVVDKNRLPINQSVYFDNLHDNRMLFAIPRAEVVYIGTTDTFYDQIIDKPIADISDVDYILDAVNSCFPEIELKVNDVKSTWAGLRPLIAEEGKSAGELSRKDEIFISKNRLISIAGGKLTGYRKMAERVIDFIQEKLEKHYQRDIGSCQTKDIRLSGGDLESDEEMEEKIDFWASTFGFEMQVVKILCSKYGSNTGMILERNKTEKELMIISELWYCVHFEQCQSLSDFYIRRTGRLYFERENIMEHYELVFEQLTSWLKLNKKQIKNQESTFMTAYNEAIAFKAMN